MDPKNALELYTKAIEALEAYQSSNAAVFRSHEQLAMKVIDAEALLRDAAAISNTEVKNDRFHVKLTPRTQKVYDEEKLKKLLTPEQFAEVVKENQRPVQITISRL